MNRIYILLAISLLLMGCQQIQSWSTSAAADDSRAFNEAKPMATPNAEQAAVCRSVLSSSDRQNRPNSTGDLPARFPVPGESVLCGYNGVRLVTVYLNPSVKDTGVARFYRERLPAQGFTLQMDNSTSSGGRFMVFGRGASETVQLEIYGASGDANFKDVFEIAYMPPLDAAGNPTIPAPMNDGASDSTTNEKTKTNGNTPNDCGDHPIGSIECAATKNPTNRQFFLEIIKPDGSRRSYTGERIQLGQDAIILHVTITGSSAQSNGEWWDKLSGDGQITNAQNTFRKEGGVWTRQRRKPTEQEYQNLIIATNVIQFADVAAARPTLIGTENVNGESCNHFQIKYDNSGANVTDYWISRRTGYAVRRQTKMNNQTTIVNESRQDENINVETPQGAN
ncbi:MAG TPA: hypothetical protein VGC76_01740 [Pyrinomonadaceae bacterium]|jgi:hypothetical protein